VTVAVQGFGKVGALAAVFMADAGSRVVAVSDAGGGIFNGHGLDAAALLHERREGADSLTSNAGDAERISNDDLLALEVDVLIPAAIDSVITDANADKVQASMVVEGANGPTTPAADAILADRGITVVPDILANAGGVAVSYLEWVQDLQMYFWDEEDVNAKLGRIMHRAYDAVTETAAGHKASLRQAAQIIAVGRVAEAHRVRGLYP
jgi:glutamate dehydrogenase (NAD(P)+)